MFPDSLNWPLMHNKLSKYVWHAIGESRYLGRENHWNRVQSLHMHWLPFWVTNSLTNFWRVKMPTQWNFEIWRFSGLKYKVDLTLHHNTFFNTLEPLWKSDLHCTSFSGTVATFSYLKLELFERWQWCFEYLNLCCFAFIFVLCYPESVLIIFPHVYIIYFQQSWVPTW